MCLWFHISGIWIRIKLAAVSYELLKTQVVMKYLLLLASFVFTAPALAGDVDVGLAGATVCAGCHGIDGKSTTPGFPNLAGQDFIYLKNQLINFRNKSRTGGQAAVMYGMVSGLSDEDIDNLATYFSSLNP